MDPTTPTTPSQSPQPNQADDNPETTSTNAEPTSAPTTLPPSPMSSALPEEADEPEVKPLPPEAEAEAAKTEMSAPATGSVFSPQPSNRGVTSDDAPANDTQTPVPNSDTAPAPTSNELAAMPAAPATGPKKRKKWLLVVIIIVVILLLAGGAAAAYVGYYLPNKPNNVVSQALANSATGKVTSAQFNGIYNGKDTQGMSYDTSFSGAAAQGGKFEATGTLDLSATKLGFDVRSVDGKDLYVKASGLKDFAKVFSALNTSNDSSLASLPALFSAADNQWYVLTQDLMKNVAPQVAVPTTQLSGSDQQKVETAYKQHPFVTVTKTFSDESVAGMNSYHYQISISKTELQAFATQVKNDKISSLPLTSDQINSLTQADFSKTSIDVWIAKDTKLFDQVKVHSTGSGDATFQVTMHDFNKSVTVTKPTDAKSMLDLMSQILGSQLSATGNVTGSDALSQLSGGATSL